jgi:hypothetical protein
MKEMLPRGESLRRAVRWISDERREGPDKDIRRLVEEACVRFDLSPLDAEFLWDTFVEQPSAPSGARGTPPARQ